MNQKLDFLMVVSNPDVAVYVAKNGVDKLFVDLEINGKQERQGHLASWITNNSMADVSAIRQVVPDAHLLVRINPISSDSQAEIDEVVDRGADSIMLPMFSTLDELASFVDMVDGRCTTVPLFETVSAIQCIPDAISSVNLTELHIGLNDLHLDMGLKFLFEPIANGFLEEPCRSLREAGIPFGIGGIARAAEGIIVPENLLGEHVRLGSTRVILSRTFHRNAESAAEIELDMDFSSEILKLRAIYSAFCSLDNSGILANKQETAEKVLKFISRNQ